MKILITGGAGFIGSHLAERLVSQGHGVWILDNFDPYYDPELKRRNLAGLSQSPRYRLVEGDIRDRELVRGLFHGERFDLVYHMAARTGVRPSLVEPGLYFEVNVTGTVNLLEACRASGVKSFIFISSSSVYGNNTKIPFSESDRVDSPVSPYAGSKLAAETVCRCYHQSYGISVFAFRLFTVYGPRQRPDMAIHRFTERALAGKPLEIYGDGSMSRDFTYVDDIVDGLVAAIDKVSGFEVINLGDSQPVTVSRLVSLLEAVIGRKVAKVYKPASAADVRTTYADIRKAGELLGYRPEVPLEEGLRRFVSWFRENLLDR